VSLSFNLFPYVCGFFTFALRLIDSPAGTGLSPRNSSSSFFYINILPVNDMPVFILKNRIVTIVSSSQPLLEVISVFESVSPGPNEDDQKLVSLKDTSAFRPDLFVLSSSLSKAS
jgi:hypothetical protein